VVRHKGIFNVLSVDPEKLGMLGKLGIDRPRLSPFRITSDAGGGVTALRHASCNICDRLHSNNLYLCLPNTL